MARQLDQWAGQVTTSVRADCGKPAGQIEVRCWLVFPGRPLWLEGRNPPTEKLLLC